MEVICLETEAFYALIDKIVVHIKEKEGEEGNKWILPEKAMEMLGIRSKTTMQKLRDEGRIAFSQPQKKVILYDRDSIMGYLDKHTKHTF